ncbi:hypothetical protein FB451DRAFT_1365273 [Mycena latifolia]|nr:hypothetical protein FB451DRAFT_1365273 [Mycena latifolia]
MQLLAIILHWGLFGMLSLQVYFYYQAFPNDRLAVKCLVYITYIAEVVQTIFLMYDAFAVISSGFQDPMKMHFEWLDVPIISGIVAFIGQSFYAYRVHILSQSWFIPTFIVLISLTSCGGAFLCGIFILEAGSILPKSPKVSAAAGAWGTTSALTDILIAFCMTYYLSKRDPGYRNTRVLVSKVIRLTIETGCLTAVVTVAAGALFFFIPDRIYYATPIALLPTLHANNILVVLNSRFQIVGGETIWTSPIHFVTSAPSHPRNTERRGTPDLVTIGREAVSDTNFHDPLEMRRTNLITSVYNPTHARGARTSVCTMAKSRQNEANQLKIAKNA